MNTNPTVTRFADKTTLTVQANTLAKVEEEGDSLKFTTISRGHYACDSDKNTYVIIEKDGKIGCSCGDMTYRCTGNKVCKHIAAFLELDSPPQIPAAGELIRKLMLMGWVGGKDDLHPAELLKPTSSESEKDADTAPKQTMEHYECPKCGMTIDTEADKLRDWKLNHIDVCPGSKKVVEPPKEPPKTPTEDAEHVRPELSEPPSEDYSSCVNAGQEEPVYEEPLLPSKPRPPISPETVPSNLATALCNMQKVDLLAVTDSDNPFHNAKYADLASVWAAIRKPLTDNGLAVIQTTEQYPQGITVVTTLVHVSGETHTSRLSCVVPQSKPDKNGQIKPNVQGLGSTITYLRRYSLAAMVGVAPIDDDGEAAMSR